MGKRRICHHVNKPLSLLAVLFAFAFASCIMSSCEKDKEDSGTPVTIDGLKYYLYPSHRATIDWSNSWSGALNIPSEVSYKGETYIVNCMAAGAFQRCTGLTKVSIPKTIDHFVSHVLNGANGAISPNYMNPFYGCTALESIEVDKENPFICSVDGVLFCKDKTKLYAYPAGSKNENYTIPESVTWFGAGVFAYCQHLSSLTFKGTYPDGVREDTFEAMDTTIIIYVRQSEVEKFKKVYSGTVLPLESLQE